MVEKAIPVASTSPCAPHRLRTIDLHIHFPKAVNTLWYGGGIAIALVALLTGQTTVGKVCR